MLLEQYLSDSENAQVLVLFGGSPIRRNEVINSLKVIENLNIYGTLSEDEGIKTIQKLESVDFVLIGGRYTIEQRLRIKNFLQKNYPNIKVIEPGVDFPYNDELIKQKILLLMNR